MFEWIKGNSYSAVVTFNQCSVTLNSCAAAHFAEVRYVMVGFDKANKTLAIKPIPKKDIDMNIVPLEQLHKISIGKGYGRISNKMIIEEVQAMIGYDITTLKTAATYDDKENVLIVNINILV
ncbi:MAG: hypothetical protein RR646_03095 [Erysipelotrichaceae bacterium]